MNLLIDKLSKLLADKSKEELSKVLEELLSVYSSENFNIKSSERNNKLRPEILQRIASSVLTDDERAEFYGLPTGCRMREGAKIISRENLVIGEHCWIGEGAMLDASGGLEIGSHTSIGLNVMLWTHDSHKLNLRGQNAPDKQNQIKRKRTKIGSNCFIGGPSVVMPGVTIGNSCIIAPGSIVYEDLPDRTVFQPYKEFLSSVDKLEDLEKRLEFLEKKSVL